MSSLSPVQSTKDLNRFSSKNFRKLKLHAALDEAKNYSDMVNVHLLRAKEQNHVLSTATQAYHNKSMTRSMSSSLSRNFAARVKRIYSTKALLKNPQMPNMVDSITGKAEHVPSINQKFKEGLQYKMALEERRDQLKNLINQERKTKDKLYLKNCRHLNSIQSSEKQIRILKEKSNKDNILINQCQNDVRDLESDLRQLDRDNTKTIKSVGEESQTVKELTKFVFQTKVELENETLDLNHLKYNQSVAYHKMNNDYMLLNQRKEEKALFLNHIHMDVAKNS